MERPTPTEHIPYYEKYIALVPEGDVLQFMEGQIAEIRALAEAVSEAQAGSRYAPGKWSLREVLGHLIDVERIFAYRALCIARGETKPLNGIEQDDYAAQAEADRTSMKELSDEFANLRRANLAMLRRLSEEASRRIGTASDNPVSVRALTYIMAGHIPHHLQIVRERYGVSF